MAGDEVLEDEERVVAPREDPDLQGLRPLEQERQETLEIARRLSRWSTGTSDRWPGAVTRGVRESEPGPARDGAERSRERDLRSTRSTFVMPVLKGDPSTTVSIRKPRRIAPPAWDMSDMRMMLP